MGEQNRSLGSPDQKPKFVYTKELYYAPTESREEELEAVDFMNKIPEVKKLGNITTVYRFVEHDGYPTEQSPYRIILFYELDSGMFLVHEEPWSDESSEGSWKLYENAQFSANLGEGSEGPQRVVLTADSMRNFDFKN